jgi:hypothetical protein
MRTPIDIYLPLGILLVLLFLGFVGGVVMHPYLYGATTSKEYRYSFELPTPDGKKIELQYGMWPALARADFFSEVRDRFIQEQASFVEADLSAMLLRVYHSGVAVLEVPIKSKGRKGSWWETPSGLYSAQAKLGTHFSSFGQVHMPYSIPFQGNFFIHGWPYYADGTPVAEGYSGGCIRLEDAYAEQVYDLVEKGMPILVFEESSDVQSSFVYSLNAPDLTARSYLVADLDNNFLLLAGSPDELVSTTLLSPLMMAVIATEHINMEHHITVTDVMLGGLLSDTVRVGSTYRVYDLLHVLLQEGDLGAMQVLEAHLGNRRVTALFGAKLHALGMEKTTLEPRRAGEVWRMTTTASDLFLFTKYLVSNRNFILAMSTHTPDTAIYGAPAFGTGRAQHPFASDSLFVGGSMAYLKPEDSSLTDSAAVALAFANPNTAGGDEDLLSVFEGSFSGVQRNILYLALGARTSKDDTQAMRSFVRSMYR